MYDEPCALEFDEVLELEFDEVFPAYAAGAATRRVDGRAICTFMGTPR
jgi:hypothetical protein